MLKEFIGIAFVIAFFLLILILLETQANKTKEKPKNYTYSDLIRKFNSMLEIVKEQKTKEILECLLEMEDLDKIYVDIKKNNIDFMESIPYDELKKETLRRIINEKIKNINESENKLENFKALQDELEYCKKRYPMFTEIFDSNLYVIEKEINEIVK